MIMISVISTLTVFGGVLFVHQLGARHASSISNPSNSFRSYTEHLPKHAVILRLCHCSCLGTFLVFSIISFFIVPSALVATNSV